MQYTIFKILCQGALYLNILSIYSRKKLNLQLYKAYLKVKPKFIVNKKR